MTKIEEVYGTEDEIARFLVDALDAFNKMIGDESFMQGVLRRMVLKKKIKIIPSDCSSTRGAISQGKENCFASIAGDKSQEKMIL